MSAHPPHNDPFWTRLIEAEITKSATQTYATMAYDAMMAADEIRPINPIQIGDLVELRSGSRRMTVLNTEYQFPIPLCHCCYEQDDQYHIRPFPIAALVVMGESEYYPPRSH